jgi:hypothetical protein
MYHMVGCTDSDCDICNPVRALIQADHVLGGAQSVVQSGVQSGAQSGAQSVRV